LTVASKIPANGKRVHDRADELEDAIDAFAPANKMEEFFRSYKARGGTYSTWDNPQDKERMRAYGMEFAGPPISIG
jgi:hypothetical protein